MATVVYMEDGPSGYRRLVELVHDSGVKRAPRGEATRDLGLTVIEVENPRRAFPLGTGRGLSRRVAAAEAVQLVGGFSDPDLLPPSFDPYREADGRFWGAYGDRIGYQLLDVVAKLKRDPATRQAVIQLWKPELDNVPFKHDYPCTLSIGFSVDDAGHLAVDVVMRSSDVWLGIPYDFFQFTTLQLTVATLIGRDVGAYRHTTLSLHLYERDIDKIKTLHKRPEVVEDDSFPGGLARNGDSALLAKQRCRRLPYVDGHYLPGEHWFRNALTGSRRD